MADGIIGDTDREYKGRKAFLFTALVTNGCSGGPIFNNEGKVCGVTVSNIETTAGMNLAITLDTLKEAIGKI